MSDFVQEISDVTKYARDTAWAEMQAADTDERRREVLNTLSAATFILGRKYQRYANEVHLRIKSDTKSIDAVLALHHKTDVNPGNEYCVICRSYYPCDTVRALTELVPDPVHNRG